MYAAVSDKHSAYKAPAVAPSLNNAIKLKLHHSLSAHLWRSSIPTDVLSQMSLRKHPEGFRLPPRSPRSPYTMSSEPNGFGLGTCGFARRRMGAGSGPVVLTMTRETVHRTRVRGLCAACVLRGQLCAASRRESRVMSAHRAITRETVHRTRTRALCADTMPSVDIGRA